VDAIKPENGPTRRLTKFTIAPPLAGGRHFYDRLDLRLFYTYGRWNEAARGERRQPGQRAVVERRVRHPTSGSMVGRQVEAWL
jgi:maltoporin